MTLVTFTYAAMPDALHDGKVSSAVHLYVSALEPTNTDFPKEEREAAADANGIVSELIGDGCCETSLLQDGCVPAEASPIFTFAIGVCWDKHTKTAHYFKAGYMRIDMGMRWTAVASLGMEQMDYIHSVVRTRENEARKRLGIKKPSLSAETKDASESSFRSFCESLIASKVG